MFFRISLESTQTNMRVLLPLYVRTWTLLMNLKQGKTIQTAFHSHGDWSVVDVLKFSNLQSF